MEYELEYIDGRLELSLTRMMFDPMEELDEAAFRIFFEEIIEKGIDFRIEHHTLTLFPKL